MLAEDFYVKYLFIAGVDRLSLAWGGGELVMRKGGLLSMEICPSPLKEVLSNNQRTLLFQSMSPASLLTPCVIPDMLRMCRNILALLRNIRGHDISGPLSFAAVGPLVTRMSDAVQTPIKLGKRGRDDSDAGSGAEDEGRPRRCVLSALASRTCVQPAPCIALQKSDARGA